jgi:aspartyl-tRNA(Asn)/glutamyl-tRNA(Gln) amidotransferase subunit A
MLKGANKDIVDDVYKFSHVMSSKLGAAVIDNISLPILENSIECYSTIAMAEAASNLAKYDGVRYGMQYPIEKSWKSSITDARSNGFGEVVKRRILMGNYILSSKNLEYLQKAQRIRAEIVREMHSLLSNKVDIILCPTIGKSIPKIADVMNGHSLEEEFYYDYYNSFASLCGIPSITFPIPGPMPRSIQIMAGHRNDLNLLSIVKHISQML